MGLFSNTAFDPFVHNAAEPLVRNMNNSRAILNVSNQGVGAFWANGAKPVFGNSPCYLSVTDRERRQTFSSSVCNRKGKGIHDTYKERNIYTQ
jgi:hypothetical protein